MLFVGSRTVWGLRNRRCGIKAARSPLWESLERKAK
jgi:hypothetical protein